MMKHSFDFFQILFMRNCQIFIILVVFRSFFRLLLSFQIIFYEKRLSFTVSFFVCLVWSNFKVIIIFVLILIYFYIDWVKVFVSDRLRYYNILNRMIWTTLNIILRAVIWIFMPNISFYLWNLYLKIISKWWKVQRMKFLLWN